jgi:hypothetical protein
MSPPGRRSGPPNPREAAYANNPMLCFQNNRARAAARLRRLDCGCADPSRHLCAVEEPTEVQVDAYAASVEHLGRIGYPAAPRLPELRALWRRGPKGRRLVSAVTTSWEVAK